MASTRWVHLVRALALFLTLGVPHVKGYANYFLPWHCYSKTVKKAKYTCPVLARLCHSPDTYSNSDSQSYLVIPTLTAWISHYKNHESRTTVHIYICVHRTGLAHHWHSHGSPVRCFTPWPIMNGAFVFGCILLALLGPQESFGRRRYRGYRRNDAYALNGCLVSAYPDLQSLKVFCDFHSIPHVHRNKLNIACGQ